jgi:hypothetical protein
MLMRIVFCQPMRELPFSQWRGQLPVPVCQDDWINRRRMPIGGIAVGDGWLTG